MERVGSYVIRQKLAVFSKPFDEYVVRVGALERTIDTAQPILIIGEQTI